MEIFTPAFMTSHICKMIFTITSITVYFFINAQHSTLTEVSQVSQRSTEISLSGKRVITLVISTSLHFKQ